MARRSTPDHVPLHANLGLLGESGRDLIRHPFPSGHPARQLREREGTHRQDPRLHRQLERRLDPLRLGQDRRRDPRQSRSEVIGDFRIATPGLAASAAAASAAAGSSWRASVITSAFAVAGSLAGAIIANVARMADDQRGVILEVAAPLGSRSV